MRFFSRDESVAWVKSLGIEVNEEFGTPDQEPQHAELGEAAEGAGGEGLPIIGADPLGESVNSISATSSAASPAHLGRPFGA